MGDFIVFDGGLNRVRFTSALRKPVQSTRHFNQYDVRRIVGGFYGGLTATQLARRERVGLNTIEATIRANSRPVDVEPLPIAWGLKRAA